MIAWALDPLGRRCFRTSLQAAAVVLLAAAGAGTIRLLPWLLAEEVPLEVCWPFAKALAAVAVETAFLVGVPFGFALGASEFVDRGEARALLALGVRPAWIAARAAVAALVIATFAFVASVAWGADAALPGRFAAQLVAQGRASCAKIREPRAALVPMVGVTWACFPKRAPRVVGALPGAAKNAFFSAASLKPSEDLRSFTLSDLVLVARRTDEQVSGRRASPGLPDEQVSGRRASPGLPDEQVSGRRASPGLPDGNPKPALTLRVRKAVVEGLSSWGRPAHLPLRARAALVALSGSWLGLLVAFTTIAGARASRFGAGVVGTAAAVSGLAALQALDRSADRPWAYALVPLAGAAAILCVEQALRAGSRLVSRLAPARAQR
jgi:hypothetical protein